MEFSFPPGVALQMPSGRSVQGRLRATLPLSGHRARPCGNTSETGKPRTCAKALRSRVLARNLPLTNRDNRTG
jgi:hypothetical protein